MAGFFGDEVFDVFGKDGKFWVSNCGVEEEGNEAGVREGREVSSSLQEC